MAPDPAGAAPLRVVMGVCGGIAAYKAVDLCRRLVERGMHVTPVMTADAGRFVGATTLSALASQKAVTSLWDGDDPVPHITLARAADVVVVAPATARLLGTYAAGISDDVLTATLLATRAPVVVCPAMHTEMWDHPATRQNVALLRARGVHVVEPEVGRLAGADEGAGRLPGTEVIVAAVEAATRPADLAGRRVLVTAGGTREPIDPVRFIANRSSGKQGHALAAEAAARGAQVTLVTAARRRSVPGVADVVAVATAAEMEEAVLSRSDQADVVIMAAAVADFRPKAPASEKLSSSEGPPELVLEPTNDILAEVGRRRHRGQVLVGFAAETGHLRQRAAEKLRRKGVDVVVANDVTLPGAGFDHDTNQASVLEADGDWEELPLMDKRELARRVLDVVVRRLAAGQGVVR